MIIPEPARRLVAQFGPIGGQSIGPPVGDITLAARQAPPNSIGRTIRERSTAASALSGV